MMQRDPTRLVVYAEDAWAHMEQMARRPSLGLMDMELQLAEVADVILVIAESEGAIHELGVFSQDVESKTKLLVVLDNRRQNKGSFISTGVVEHIERASRFTPVIFSDFGNILQSARDLDERLSALDDPAPERIEDLRVSDKQALFLLCDLLAIIGPAPIEHCKVYLSEILDEPPWNIETLLSLAVACRLIEATAADGMSLYTRRLDDDEDAYLMRSSKPLSLASHRTAFLGAMYRIPSTPHWWQSGER